MSGYRVYRARSATFDQTADDVWAFPVNIKELLGPPALNN